jgi:hypothetical protein
MIAETVMKLVNTPSALDAIRLAYGDVRYRLGGPGASARVADIALNMLKGYRQ